MAWTEAFDDMFQAARLNDQVQVQNLLTRGLDPDLSDPDGNTLLMEAAKEGASDVFRLLVEAGAKLTNRNQYGDDALMLAALKGRLELVEALLNRGVVPNRPGWNALIYAAMNGHDEVVRTLLNHGAQVDAASDNGTTALMMAAKGGHMAVVETLMGHRANIHSANDAGMTALQYAIQAQNSEIAGLLLEAGAER